MPPAGFQPAIPAGERLQTYALDRSATGIRCYSCYRKFRDCVYRMTVLKQRMCIVMEISTHSSMLLMQVQPFAWCECSLDVVCFLGTEEIPRSEIVL